MIHYLKKYIPNANDAGKKAPEDIYAFCKEKGWNEVLFEEPGWVSSFQKIRINLKNWFRLFRQCKKGDVVFYQYPMCFGERFGILLIPFFQSRGIRFVGLIHDLESLRQLQTESDAVEECRKKEFGLLGMFDALIVHNEHMKDYLVQNGFRAEHLIPLELFDYRTETPFLNHQEEAVVIAGNLGAHKSPYIYCFAENNPEVKLHLYGGGYDSEKNAYKNAVYCGSFPPEEITGAMRGRFGIVWDGASDHDCIGALGQYLKYNNPHKTSMYLAAGIPVIVWKKAAIADFVMEHSVGVTVSDLSEVKDVLKQTTEEEYQRLRENAVSVGKQVRKGYYFSRAINKALEICNYGIHEGI